MPTDLAKFYRLPRAQQTELRWDEGTLLATRWEGPNAVLFTLFGFFCEVRYDSETNTLLRTHCFTDNAGLEKYLNHVSLAALNEPEW